MTDSDSIVGTTATTKAGDDAESDLTGKSTAGAASEIAGEVEDDVASEPKARAVAAAEEALVSDGSASDEGEGSDEEGEDSSSQEAAKKPKPVPAEPPPRAKSSFGAPGKEVKLIHFDTEASRANCRAILEEQCYAWPEGIRDPQVIMDVGAYVGASSIAFARRFPSATVHAYEPGSAARALLKENAAAYTNIKIHEEAVWDRDQERQLYDGKEDPLFASLVSSTSTVPSGELVKCRHADEVLDGLDLMRADALKINTGGSEVAVLQALIRHMEATLAVYVTYRSETDRRRIDLILCATHMLMAGTIEGPHRGQLCYGLRRVLDLKASGDRDAVRLHRTPLK